MCVWSELPLPLSSRSVLTGFNDSAGNTIIIILLLYSIIEYVFNQLEENGYEPYRQYFTVRQ